MARGIPIFSCALVRDYVLNNPEQPWLGVGHLCRIHYEHYSAQIENVIERTTSFRVEDKEEKHCNNVRGSQPYETESDKSNLSRFSLCSLEIKHDVHADVIEPFSVGEFNSDNGPEHKEKDCVLY